MRLLGAAGVGVFIGGALLMSAQSMSTHKVRTKRQFNNRQQQNNYGNGYQSRQGNSNNARQQQQQQQQQWYSNSNSNNNNNNDQQYSTDYNTLLQQYAALTSAANSNTGYYDTYSNSISDYAADAYVPAATFASSVSENPDSSPALSALALLGFLYFLNLIQDVLQNNGRRKRSVTLPEETEEGFYSTSYLEDPLIIPEGMEEESPRFLTDEGTEIVEEEIEEKGDTEQEAVKAEERMDIESPVSGRSFSFLENFFIKLPQALGLTRRHPQIDRDGRDESSWDIGNFISSRIKMISSIMSFLQDPRPSRIRRGVPLTEDDVVRINATEQQSFIDRFRRFTHSMNAWYDALGGENYEPTDDTSSGMAAKVHLE
ncbi:uncharacterized protein [Macrobrachium rosenbergii]|uniref:uncharacterized protein isoform X2 n=1 Tax=Macrobrachium rosenbergii TaxID=79674 RepID=UPI0034D4325E